MERSRNHPLILAAAAGVLIFSILGAAVVKDVRNSAATRRDEAAGRPKTAGFGSVVRPVAAAGACGDCGLIDAIRQVRIEDRTHYRVTLKMDDGTVRTLSLTEAPANAVGARVKLLNGALAAAG